MAVERGELTISDQQRCLITGSSPGDASESQFTNRSLTDESVSRFDVAGLPFNQKVLTTVMGRASRCQLRSRQHSNHGSVAVVHTRMECRGAVTARNGKAARDHCARRCYWASIAIQSSGCLRSPEPEGAAELRAVEKPSYTPPKCLPPALRSRAARCRMPWTALGFVQFKRLDLFESIELSLTRTMSQEEVGNGL